MILTVLTGKLGIHPELGTPVLLDEVHDFEALVIQLGLDLFELGPSAHSW
jgi:hypothetical protein